MAFAFHLNVEIDVGVGVGVGVGTGVGTVGCRYVGFHVGSDFTNQTLGIVVVGCWSLGVVVDVGIDVNLLPGS